MFYVLTTLYAACVLLLCHGVNTQAQSVDCAPHIDNGPFQIDIHCIDPLYKTPVIDSETQESEPVNHWKVSGHFNDTNVRFNIYLPLEESWEGRFFQHVYPTQNSSAWDRIVEFAFASGGYAIQATGVPGYRAEAAVAKFSREVAIAHYQTSPTHIYGYIYGGSGGSLQTIGAIENTSGVWDGALPFVLAVPHGMINSWSLRGLGGFAMGAEDDIVIEGVRPGGGGLPFLHNVLSDAAYKALEEVSSLGIPLRGWEDFDGAGRSGVSLWDMIHQLVIPQIESQDPTYFEDFWGENGYLGTEDSTLGELFRKTLTQVNATITKIDRDAQGVPSILYLDNLPSNVSTLGLEFRQYHKNGTITSFSGALVDNRTSIVLNGDNDHAQLAGLNSGSVVELNNRRFLATFSFHRHQVPPSTVGFYAWDYLNGEDGQPRYPQRERLLSPQLASATSGNTAFNGNITMKTMLSDNLVDYDAFPWHADWYSRKVRQSLGEEEYAQNFRLYFQDNADHLQNFPRQNQASRIVEYDSFLERHLRYLSAWVEEGILPPDGTRYDVVDGQVITPRDALSRQGIQPVITLAVQSEAEVISGQEVLIIAQIEAPPGTGDIIQVEIDYDGTGQFETVEIGSPESEINLSITHIFNEPGVYYTGIRAASLEAEKAADEFAVVKNLGRVRIDVLS